MSKECFGGTRVVRLEGRRIVCIRFDNLIPDDTVVVSETSSANVVKAEHRF